MCGIVGFIGNGNARDVILKGLSRLEYRGYDSAGIAVMTESGLQVQKYAGKVAELHDRLDDSFNQSVGIGHTRWATHGEPTDRNAHPHLSPGGRFAVVHNGIIENYAELKAELQSQGFAFISDTDTEVIAVLLEAIMQNTESDTVGALRLCLNQLIGAYAIAVLDREAPDTVYAARMSSPLVIGVGSDAYYIASDAMPIIEYTREVIYLQDGQLAVLQRGQPPAISSIADAAVHVPYIDHLELNVEAIEKSGFEHFMLKEINEQPQSIEDSLRGRVRANEGIIRLGGIQDFEDRLAHKARKITIVACGTSYHAGLLGKYWIEKIARLPVEVDIASEFRYRNPIMNEDDVLIAISQSGETADTLAAITLAKDRGALALGITNVVGSSIARATDAGIYTHAGPEMSVASTKAFTTQLSVLFALALRLGHMRTSISELDYRFLLTQLSTVPKIVQKYLQAETDFDAVVRTVAATPSAVYIGRAESYPVALEGALKLKEISYVHAEGFAAGEMKHGPIALVDDALPVFVIAPDDELYEKTISNLQEIKARKGKIILVTDKAEATVADMADFVVTVPRVHAYLTPFVTAIPLQIIAYHAALARGCDVDKPRNLAKSVTVE